MLLLNIGNKKILATCTYPINKFKKAEILNIANAHRFIIFKNNGSFDVIESSEQKKLEDEIQKISVLSSGVAHDFNNLLTIIKGNTDMAMNNLSRKTSKDTDIVKSINVNRIIIKLLEMLTLFFQKNDEINFETEINLDPELWKIKGDSGKIEQSILNIIINAKDAMPEGGRITISTCNIKSPKEHKGDYICISIKDTGVGMELDVIDHIFDPFFTTKGPKGTGLGLSLVYQIVEEFQGWIEVSSEINKGTIFRIYIPAYKN